jgi:plastocyanin
MTKLVMRNAACFIAIAFCDLLSGAGANAADVTVKVVSGPLRYDPAEIHVKKGDRVTCINTTSFPHTATPDDANTDAFARVTLFDEDDEGTTVIKADPGTIRYHCEFHNSMHGTMIIDSADGPQQ